MHEFKDYNCIYKSYFDKSHVYLKGYYNFFQLRHHLHNESRVMSNGQIITCSNNTTGLYSTNDIKRACHDAGLKYNTIRQQLRTFQKWGLLQRNKAKQIIKIHKLTGDARKLHVVFDRHFKAITAAKNPAVYFADLLKIKQIKSNIHRQAFKEAGKCKDRHNGKKLTEIVRDSKQPIGKKQGINLSLGTIGRTLGRSRTTAFKHIERMHRQGLIERRKHSIYVCDANQFKDCRKALNLYGRLFVRNGLVFERLQNSYVLELDLEAGKIEKLFEKTVRGRLLAA